MILHGDHVGDEKFAELVGLDLGLVVENFGQIVVILLTSHANGHFLAHHVSVTVVKLGIQVNAPDLS